MTSPAGPSNPTPPAGPGRHLFGDYADQLGAIGCEVIDPLAAAAEAIAAAAPPLDRDQHELLARVFGRAA